MWARWERLKGSFAVNPHFRPRRFEQGEGLWKSVRIYNRPRSLPFHDSHLCIRSHINFPPINGNRPLQSHTSQTGNRQGLTTARPSHHPNFPASPSHSCPPSSSLSALPEPLFLFPCTLSTTPDVGTKQPSCLPFYRPLPRARNPQKQDTLPKWFPSRRPWRESRHWWSRELQDRYLAPVCPYPGGYAGRRRERGSWVGSGRICGRGVPI